MRRCVWSRNLVNEEAMLRQKKKKSYIIVSKTHGHTNIKIIYNFHSIALSYLRTKKSLMEYNKEVGYLLFQINISNMTEVGSVFWFYFNNIHVYGVLEFLVRLNF